MTLKTASRKTTARKTETPGNAARITSMTDAAAAAQAGFDQALAALKPDPEAHKRALEAAGAALAANVAAMTEVSRIAQDASQLFLSRLGEVATGHTRRVVAMIEAVSAAPGDVEGAASRARAVFEEGARDAATLVEAMRLAQIDVVAPIEARLDAAMLDARRIADETRRTMDGLMTGTVGFARAVVPEGFQVKTAA